MESFSQVFNAVKQSCESELSPTAYGLWIKPIEPVEFKEGTAVLYLKSEFQKNIVMTKYMHMLSAAFKDILGFDVAVEIITEEAIDSQLLPHESDLKGITQTAEPVKKQKLAESYNGGEYEYTFDTFIVGSSNTFAYAACKAVAQQQSGAYNPLFIYGPSGLGKTHLLMAISHEIKRQNPDTNILYINGEAFANELMTAIGRQATNEFREKYRRVDILLMDDIQFLAGKTQTQEEFFYTFNDLHQVGKQIVLTSDRPPKDIKTLEERLRTRFEWGLLADISPPDFETRIAIIRRKAQLLDIEMPDEVAEFIANRLKNNIRQLEGAVKKIKAYKLLAGSPPSISMAQTVIRDILNDNQPTPVTVERIIKEVGRTFGVSEEDIRSSKRSSQISTARQIAMYIVREITQMPLAEIGKEFNGRDHATIVYALQKVENMIQKDSHQKEIIEDIIKNIRDN